MKKTVVLGDLHGNSVWKLIVHTENPDRVIFLGDYFDSFDFSSVEQIHNFKEIIQYKESNPQVEVIMLIGNHDHHYFPEIGRCGTSGYQATMFPSISQLIDENRQHLQMAYKMDEYLFTHAGVSSEWMDEMFGEDEEAWTVENMVDKINELFKHQPRCFTFHQEGWDGSGDDTYQTPIWIRPRSLMKVNKNTLRDKVIQIVGHTQVSSLGSNDKWAGTRYWFADCLNSSREYLVIENGIVNVHSAT